MKTIAVNLKNEKCDVKCCRTKDNKVPSAPQEGCFGNPFFVEKYGREKCIKLYKDYFYKKIESEPEFKKAVLALKGKKLGCFCKPLACHVDIIVEYLEKENV